MLHNNPNNPHKNEKGSTGKKLLIVGTIALLVAGGIVYALNPFNNETLPTPTPYTPPAITTPVPTQTPSLEDKLPAYAPLSAAQIKEYTLTSLQLAYEAKTQKDVDISKAWLDRVLYALKVSNFEYEKVLALYEAADEWKYGGSVPANVKADTIKWSERNAPRMAKNPDKDEEVAFTKRGLEQILGSRYGAEIK